MCNVYCTYTQSVQVNVDDNKPGYASLTQFVSLRKNLFLMKMFLGGFSFFGEKKFRIGDLLVRVK